MLHILSQQFHKEVMILTVNIETARRFILGKQGLWLVGLRDS